MRARTLPALVVVAGLVVNCAAHSALGPKVPLEPAPTRVQILSYPLYGDDREADISAFLADHPLVVEGIVVAAKSRPLPPDRPRAGSPPPRSIPHLTTYRIRVARVIAGEAQFGDVVEITQPGGIRDGVAYQDEGAPPFRLGQRYLLFLSFWPNGNPGSSPSGRFEVGADGRLASVDPMWSGMKIARSLVGKTVAEAARAVKAAAGGQ